MGKLLRVIMRLSINGFGYEVMEYEIVKLGHKVCILRNETRQQKTRQIAKEDIMALSDISDQEELCLRIWCHESDLQEAKDTLKAGMEKKWEAEKKRCEAAMDRVRITGFMLGTEEPSMRRETFEDFIART